MEPLCVADYERLAEERLEPGAFGYYAGGAGDELALRENVEAWRRLRLRPRVLVDVADVSAATTVLGAPVSMPVLVAPTAIQRLAHPDGEPGMARAAAAAGTLMCLSTLATATPAEVAAAAPGSPRWFQLYVFRDRQVSLDLVAQAREHGYEALVITVDFPLGGWRERDRRTGFKVEHPVAVNPDGPPMSTEELFAQHDPTLDWDDIAEFADAAGMPLMLKGILSPEDAQRAASAGASAIIVSNHGGRQLDTVLSGADALPPIVDVVGGRIDLLVDGGIRRGWDVAKALSLGADAVLVGRPLLWGLAREGQAGAEAVMRQLLDEFDSTLALLGCPRARDLDPSYVTRAPW